MASTPKTSLAMGSKGRNDVKGLHGTNEVCSVSSSMIFVVVTIAPRPPPTRQSASKLCRVCGDEIRFKDDGKLFVACYECGFPVCQLCYEYERIEGNQCCPQCNTRYKRHKGFPRVAGDDEDNVDANDFEDEFPMKSNGDTPDRNHSENEDYTHQQWQPNVSAVSSIAGSITGKDFEGEKNLYSDAEWKERVEKWKAKQEKRGLVSKDDGGENDEDDILMAEARQPLWRKIPIPSSQINPYRIVIVFRLVILAFFFSFRVTTPVKDAYPLWLIAVICEIWFALSWILDQFPKWFPINRETYLDRLTIRFEPEGEPNRLLPIDVMVNTLDPFKEPPIVTANTILSILSVDYPVEKVSCYVSDDGASMLLFDTLSETAEFARRWVPFCKKHSIEPRAPEYYFSQKMDYLKDKVQPSFVKERRAMKREYEEFKVRINALVANAQKKPDEGWVMQDGTPWPGNNTSDHPGMIQAYLGSAGALDVEGKELPRLVYVSREKRPGYRHHKKAGAMNAMVRVSGVLTNAPFILNLECDHYINNSKAVREAMCFLMDPQIGKKLCYVQFPQRFDGIDSHDRYANRNVVFYDIYMKGLDGIQGPVYVGTGCVFNRQALYGYDPPASEKRKKMICDCWPSWCCCCCGGSRNSKSKKEGKLNIKKKKMMMQNYPKKGSGPVFDLEEIEEGLEGYDKFEKSSLMSQKKFEKRFGQSPVFIASTLMEDGGLPEGTNPTGLIKEAIHVISCGYEEKTEWGKEVGWIYGSVAEDILTGFKMHCRGWKSVYCVPERAAFKGSAPINLSDRLHQVLRWALGSVEIFLSSHCPLWYGYGGKLKWLQRLAYINTIVYPFTSIPLLAYCTIPAVCLLSGKFIIPTLTTLASIWLMALVLCIIATGVLEIRWSGVSIEDWWRNEQFWVIGGVSAHLFAVFQGLLKVLAGVNTNITVESKTADDSEFGHLYLFKWTILLLPPITLIIMNVVGVVAGVSDGINNGYGSWGPLLGKLFFAFMVIVHLFPFIKENDVTAGFPSAAVFAENYPKKRSGPVFDLEEIEGLEGYGKFEKSSLMSHKKFEKRFGQSPVFIVSTLMEDGGLPEVTNPIGLIKEAIHVISCGYEEKTEWGKEIYGSVAEYILTGFKMHCRGWKSVYCVPERAAFKVSAPINLSDLSAFKVSAPINLSDRLHDVLRWALGSVEIFLSSHFPLWYGYGGKLKWLQRLAYTNTIVYPFTSIPFLAYCTIPAVCLLSGKFIIPTLTSLASIWLMALVLSIIATRVLEIRWSGVSIEDWWRNEQFWVIRDDSKFGHLYLFKWTILVLPPITLIILNVVRVVAGVSDGINNGYGSWGKLFFAFLVIVHLFPFLKGLTGKQNKTPAIIILWSILLASIFSLVWVRIDPFLPKQTGPILKQCAVEC
ncbi:hypothetical protein HHK36_022484 [Tetracentron sinense]|uniref:Cellulose synthase n=1 Tax=Tetracentron sinense TaxID=13715 RepID=A0A834YPP2_TETSI|nr:hypothetical protein HHK36_022484 [Tetracentron sinense]